MATLTDTAGERVMGRIVPVTDEVSGEEEEKEKRKWINDAGRGERKSKKRKILRARNPKCNII